MSFKLKFKSKKDKEFISINKITTVDNTNRTNNRQNIVDLNQFENAFNNIKQESNKHQKEQQQKQQSKSNNQRFREFLHLFHNYRLNTTSTTPTRKSTRQKTQNISNQAPIISVNTTKIEPQNNDKEKNCILCCNEYNLNLIYKLRQCEHEFCETCLNLYLKYQINDSRIQLQCPQCSIQIHPNDIKDLCLKSNNLKLIEKYEEFMLRRVLAGIQDVRWCPAPDCTYAVIASGCANCPQLTCMRPNCNTSFCYHCKQYWHPNLTCDDAAITNAHSSASSSSTSSSSSSSKKPSKKLLKRSNSNISIVHGGSTTATTSNTMRTSSAFSKDELKQCPKCKTPIVKMDDGSCNHITCAVCGCEFCWLCMKEISDLHYLSPSGCTFWGKKPWSRKKKILWQLGTLIGAPVGIALVAVVAIPGILIGLPIWSGRKIYTKFKSSNKTKRNLLVVGTVLGSILIAPIVAALCVGIGVPILLAYIYGVVPISLCRSGMCGVTTNNNGGVKLAFDEDEQQQQQQPTFTIQQQQQLTQIQTTSNDTTKQVSVNNLVLNSSQTKLSSLNNNKNITESCGSILKETIDKSDDLERNKATVQETQSIGACTANSLSASFSQIDRLYDDSISDQITDRDSTSNRALAGSTYQQQQSVHIQSSQNNNIKINKTNKIISFNDNVSITTISEKSSLMTQSANPSVIALAGSIKENDDCTSQRSKSPSLKI